MYGILAGCIAAMAMFLGLFALSVETGSDEVSAKMAAEVEVGTTARQSTE